MPDSTATVVVNEPFRAYVDSLFQALGSREPMEVLAEMPETLRRSVAGLSREQDGTPEAPGKWSVRQVVQHLADSELVGGFRYRMVFSQDAPELPAYDQELWAERMRYQDSHLETALADFAALRAMNLRLLRRATPEDLQNRVMRHPERGDEPLGHMIRLYAGHDLKHLGQIRRIRQAIGDPVGE
jgi:uncharacterized damage-inducible protein DinB